MFGLKIFVQVQTFRRVPPVLPCNFCHPVSDIEDDNDVRMVIVIIIVITILEVLLHPLALVGVPADSHGGGDRLQIRQDPIPLHLLVR